MKRLVILSSLAIAISAHAAPKAAIQAAANARPQTPSLDAHMRLARTTVLRDIKLHGNLSSSLEAPKVTAVVLSPEADGKTVKPITGYGTIHVTVEQAGKTRLAKLLRPFSKYANREFDVAVDAKGQAQVLNSGWSQTVVGKVGRSLRNGPGRLIASVKQNPNAKLIAKGAAIATGTALLGAATGGGAIAAALGAKLALLFGFGSGAGVAVTKTVGFYSDGRTQVNKLLGDRSLALKDTVDWNQAQITAGKTPTLNESYLHYNALRPDQSIVRNYTLGGFAEALQAHGQ